MEKQICQLVLSYCDKVPGIINLIREMVYFGSSFPKLRCTAMWTYGSQSTTWQEYMAKEVSYVV